MSIAPTKRRRRALPVLLVLALIGTSVASFAGAGGSATPIAVTDYVKFVGGKRGKANRRLSPIVIGWVNLQGGAVQVGPNATPAAEIAVKLVNDSLNGIGGHPLVLRECFVRNTEEEGTKCGQQMANDRRISVVLIGGMVIGNQSLYAALGGKKPIVGGVIILPVDEKQKNGFGLFGSGTSVLGPYGTFARDVLKAKDAAVVFPQVPGIAENATVITNALKRAGISTKQVGYDPNATDLVAPLTAAGAQNADLTVVQSNAAGCVGMAKALAQLGSKTRVLTNPLCLDPQVAQGLGGDYPKWIYAIASSLGFDLTDRAVPPFRAVFKRYGRLTLTADPWTPVAFGQVLTVVRWLNAIGPTRITPAAVTRQARAFRGPVPLGAPSVRCGKYPAMPAVCNDQTQFFGYEGAGKFKRLSGWLRPPA